MSEDICVCGHPKDMHDNVFGCKVVRKVRGALRSCGCQETFIFEKLDELRATIAAKNATIHAQAAEIERLRETLTEYADSNNWTPVTLNSGANTDAWTGEGAGYDLAREALAEMPE